MKIIVFPDGETFNTIEDCSILEIPDGLNVEEVEELLDEEGTENSQIKILQIFDGSEFKQ